MTKLIAITGPTASGKTEIAIKLAQKISGEIISADSRLVYKDFNIGTAKPDENELSKATHHLIDIVSPQEDFTVEKYVKTAEILINEIYQRGNIPIICGGTGFYIKSLLEGLNMPKVPPDEQFRKKIRELAEEKGREYIHNMLVKVDYDSAEKLHPNDLFRIIRALEVYEHLGQPMSKLKSIDKSKYNVLYVGLDATDREFLYNRINHRADNMIQMGMIEEVKSLINKYGKTVSLLKTLGYREICEYLDNIISLEETIEKIKKNTRNYAKRQLTWFRANEKTNWFFIDKMNTDQICEEILKIYYE